MFKTDNQLSHPVTNGKTKFMILLCIIFLGALAAMSIIFGFVGIFNLTGIALVITKSSFIGLAGTCIGGLVYAVHSFFDTREAAQKSNDKLAREQANYNYKLEKEKIKLEMLKIKKGIK